MKWRQRQREIYWDERRGPEFSAATIQGYDDTGALVAEIRRDKASEDGMTWFWRMYARGADGRLDPVGEYASSPREILREQGADTVHVYTPTDERAVPLRSFN